MIDLTELINIKRVARILLTTWIVFLSCGWVEAQSRRNPSQTSVRGDAARTVRSLERTIPRLMKEGDVPGEARSFSGDNERWNADALPK